MCVLLVSHGPGLIEMPSLDTARSNESGLSSLAGCLGSDVGVPSPRTEGWKRTLAAVPLGWGRGAPGGRRWGPSGLLPLLHHSQVR